MKYPPVFCDHCPRLALAFYEEAPLCVACLHRAIKQQRSYDLAGKIRPVVIHAKRSKTAHKDLSFRKYYSEETC